MSDETHSFVCHDSFVCLTLLIHTCDMTHRYVWHDSFICATWFIHMCDMTHSYVWHDSSICVTWLIHMCDMTAPPSFLFPSPSPPSFSPSLMPLSPRSPPSSDEPDYIPDGFYLVGDSENPQAEWHTAIIDSVFFFSLFLFSLLFPSLFSWREIQRTHRHTCIIESVWGGFG